MSPDEILALPYLYASHAKGNRLAREILELKKQIERTKRVNTTKTTVVTRPSP